MSEPALETRGLCRRFGGLTAANNVSLKLAEGARHALIGPNGAGKTTLVNLLSGVLKPSSGAVLLAGEDVTSLSAPQRVRRGLVRTFQINQPVPRDVASRAALPGGRRASRRRGELARAPGADDAVVGEVEALLRRFDLIGEMDRPARALAYGKQRLLEIALALARRRARCFSTNRPPACRSANAPKCSPRWWRCPPT